MGTITLIMFLFRIIGYVLSFQLPPLENRIIGGEDAKIHEVPYQLSMFNISEFKCGASIIGQKWALTAAHCVVDMKAKNLKVGAGNEIRSKGQFYDVLNIIKHESYNEKTFDNDIALLQIKGSFKFDNKVKEVNLPNVEPESGLRATISGWGRTTPRVIHFRIPEFPENLKKATVSIIDRKSCKENYKKIRTVSKKMICAGDATKGGKDACENDSGGPLVANNKLYGIVSWGKGCGNAQYPGVYTNVAQYSSWINKYASI